jgi:hypothetical protein
MYSKDPDIIKDVFSLNTDKQDVDIDIYKNDKPQGGGASYI